MPRWLVMLLGGTCIVFGLAWLLDSRATTLIDSYAECVATGNPVAESEPPVCEAQGHSYAGPLSSVGPSPSGAPLVSQSFDLLVDADSHGNYPRQQVLITTADQWQRYWRDVHAGLPTTPPILPVDFSTSQVVALSLGSRPTSGYHIKVTDILTSTAGTTVDFVETSPGARCVETASPMNPYYVVRTGHVPLPVSFRLTAEVNSC